MSVYTDGVHLTADSVGELHAFAKKMGLKREWFQDKGRWLHYDLTTFRAHARALALGAISTNKRTDILKLRRITSE